ncbi:DedA family protein [Saccharothrix australiensis]|uniref:Membrane protein DedA with SNARE-associated domain n=1 Tax=Saccharothrix australiensis TaxID=2072 RepID=A0A495VRT9_9PSEU|nr:VTT domain-containing protein [Saccharothrix australiensis]RKT52071.1 membrane protein DedA with SNARE-associated domain [Saccharothrix australiensis]
MTALLVLFVVAAVPLAPTEAVLIGCGVLAATGRLPLAAVVAVAALGCFVADLVNYSLGRSAGMRALRRFSRKPGSRAVVQWTAAKLALRGEPVLVAVRWVPGGGLVGALLAGSLRWPSRRFAPVALVGATLWSGYTALIGYFGGRVVDDPLPAVLLSWAAAMLISIPLGMAVRAAQRRTVDAAAAPAAA